jgi:hypothetical protein
MLAKVASRFGTQIDLALRALDVLESRTEDPDIVMALFTIDHLITQTRGDVDALRVLGERPVRQLGRGPALAYALCREATQEITDFRRVFIGDQADVQVNDYARSGVVRILAVLLSNATTFSERTSRVVMSSAVTPHGLTIEVVDEGLGLPDEELSAANSLLADPQSASQEQRLAEGRIGLVVAAKLAASLSLAITLHSNPGKGTTARVRIPHSLLLPSDPGPVQHSVVPPSMAPSPAGTGRAPARPAAASAEEAGRPAPNGAAGLAPLPKRSRARRDATAAGVAAPDPSRMQALRTSGPSPDANAGGRGDPSP